MRVRKHHAWGALLILLFALPVLRPEGIPALERPVANFVSWFGRLTVLNPRLWGSDVGLEGEAGPRAKALREENAVLREAYARRTILNDQLEELIPVLESLGSSGLDRRPRALLARVLRSADASGHRRSILIDRGSADGLRPGVPVVAGSVYVGRVELVFGQSALVKLVTDRCSRMEVAVRTTKNRRLLGFVRGAGRGADDGQLDLRFVRVPDGAGRLQKGATVLTSNADALVPAGLIVAFVSEVTDDDLDGLPCVTLEPALDLSRSTRVLVLLPP